MILSFFQKKKPTFEKGVVGYRSIVHLKNVVSSSMHQTQPTNQQKKTPPHCHNLKCYDYFTPVAQLGMLPMAAEKADSLINFGAWKCTY